MDNKEDEEIGLSAKYDSTTNKATLTLDKLLSTTDGQTYTLTVMNGDKKVSEKTFSYKELKDVKGVTVDGLKVPDTNKAITTYITSDNVDNLALKVTTDGANDEDTTVVVKLKDKSGRETTGTAKLPANASQVVVNNFAPSEVEALDDGGV